jgi:hypothetical protein
MSEIIGRANMEILILGGMITLKFVLQEMEWESADGIPLTQNNTGASSCQRRNETWGL